MCGDLRGSGEFREDLVLNVVSPQEGINLSAGVALLGLDVVVLLRLRDAMNLWRRRLEAVLLGWVALLGGFQPVVAQLVLLEFKLLGEQLLAVDELQLVLLLLVELLRDLDLGWSGLGLLSVERALLLEVIQGN